MKTITEDYCSFEVAKLLKEKGFDWKCNSHYWSQDLDTLRYSDYPQNWNCASDDWYSCPTHQMAMKWLREVHNLFIVIDRHYFVVDRISHIASGFKYSIEIKTINTVYTYNDYRTHEQAVEAALKYVFENLI